MASKKVSFGMVGGDLDSFVGNIHHKAALFDGQCKLAAGCFSRNAAKNAATGEAWDVPEDRIYSSYMEMCEKELAREDRIDFVVVTTPNNSHYCICKLFLENGFNIMCEKPFTSTAGEARELKSIADKNGCLICLMYTNNGFVSIKKARELVKNGKVGNIKSVYGCLLTDFMAENDLNDPDNRGWRCNPEVAGTTNCAADIGTHVENTVKYITGLDIDYLTANLGYYYDRRLDNTIEVLVKFKNGANGVFWGSQIAIGQGHHLKVEVYGDKGSIVFDSWDSNNVTLSYLENPYEKHVFFRDMDQSGEAFKFSRVPSGHVEGTYLAFINVYKEYVRAILDKLANKFTKEADYDFPKSEDGISGVIFAEKCLESHQKGGIRVML